MEEPKSFLDIYDFNRESYLDFLNDDNSFKKQIDDFGNLVLQEGIDEENIKQIDKFLIKMNPSKKKLNREQVEQFMPTTLSELTIINKNQTAEYSDVPGDFSEEINEEIRSQLDQEKIMEVQLDEMSDILDKEIERGVQFQEKSTENFAAAKELIVSQRIKLGEGTLPSDFDDKFPFLPLGEKQPENDEFPFA
jgi:hypothetical protein